MSAELIARLEMATEGSRELDAAIVIALNIRPDWTENYGELFCKGESLGEPVIRANSTGGKHSLGHPPIGDYLRFTTSIDAALTLIPEHYSYELTQSAVEPPAFARARLWDWRRAPLGFDPGNEWKSEGNRPLPLSICIAALRARATS